MYIFFSFKDTLFGEITDSSDDEMEQNAQTLENIIEEYDEEKPASETLHLTEFCSQVLKNSSVKTHLQESHERSQKLENEESMLSSDSMLRTSEYLHENNTKSETEEKHLNKESDFEQMHTAAETISPSTEKLSEKMISKTEIGHVLEETNDFVQKEEKKRLIETKDDCAQGSQGSEEQQTKEPISTAENPPVTSKNVKDPSNDKEGRVMESVFEDLQTESYSGKASLLCEKQIEHLTVKGQNAAAERNNEPLIEGEKNVSNCEFLPETNLSERVEQPGASITCTESIEKNFNSLEASNKPHSVVEMGNQQNGSKVNGKNEQADVATYIGTLTRGLKQSYHGGEIIEAMNYRSRKNLSDGASEETKLEDTPKEKHLQLERLLDENIYIKSTQEELICKSSTNKLPTEASTAEDSLLKSEGFTEPSQVPLEVHNATENAFQVGQVENANITPKNMSKVESIGSSLNSYTEDLHPLRERLMEINYESRKLTEAGTIQSLKVGLNEKDSRSSMHGDSQFEKNSSMITNELPDTKKYATEEKGLNYCSASNEAASAQNMSNNTVQPMQNASQSKNGAIESALSVMTGDSEANIESMDVAFPSPDKENADHTDPHHSKENWKNKKSETVESEGDKMLTQRDIKWDYHNPSNKKDKIDFGQDKNDGTFNKPQASVTLKSCSKDNAEMLSSDGYCPNNIKSIDTNTENKLLLNHGELLIPRDARSRNDTIKNINEKTARDADAVSSTEIRSRGIDEVSMLENSVSVGKSSVTDSSEEEFYPIRKVNCAKIHPGCAVSSDISCPVKNSEASLPPSTTSSDGARHEVFPVVTKEECSKDKEAKVGYTDSSVNEGVEKTWEHSYAAEWPCANENTTLKTEPSSAIEKLEENASVITLLPSQELSNKKTISGKSSMNDPDANDNTAVLHTKHPVDREVHSDLPVEKSNMELKRSVSTSESRSDTDHSYIMACHIDDGSDTSHNKAQDINNDKGSTASKTHRTSISPISGSSNSNNKLQKVLSEKLSPPVPSAKNRVDQTFNSSDLVIIKAQEEINDSDDTHLQTVPICKRKKKNQSALPAETILANVDTSTRTMYYPKTLTKIMQEMGPPLPPLLPPLLATPPRTVQRSSPVASISSQSSLPSPLDELISPLHKTPVPPLTSALPQISKYKSSSSSSSSSTLSPSEMSVGQRILSSPLQFCSSTPKHALPVPGRLPPSTPCNSVPPAPQENSVKILDSMYPELSARARTLNILKGNIQFNRSSSLDGKGSHQISGFKAIASPSTAFVKTRIRFKSDPEKLLSNVNETGKRKLPSVTMPKNVKRPCLEGSRSSTLNPCSEERSDGDRQCIPDGDSLDNGNSTKSTDDCNSKSLSEMEKTEDPDTSAVTVALEKVSEACFDLLPVIRSRVLVGNTSKVPILRDEEKEVVYELAVEKKSLAEPALQTILNKLKKQKTSLGHNYIQSLCRIYVGICHQLGDLEKARLFCYTLLKEGIVYFVGRLGQIGLREGFFPAVENISSVIGAFLQHAKEKDVAWGVQLAAAYALFDLGPSNPSKILEAIHAWKAVNTISLPSAVLNGISEVNSLLTCTEEQKIVH
ncbi:PREDICTED: little elongation complex subunit 1-like [Thamnophis sirtalis]|uniref:Little elongation complex subunit 1-like n=1 Tax=Thamnophis sirtalis TaxID=35019 RepID=A0A6I9Y275_9SAUR|nr:PREDICTED: little elongation complex subunit 1-like [Thamnophis sirtalis]